MLSESYPNQHAAWVALQGPRAGESIHSAGASATAGLFDKAHYIALPGDKGECGFEIFVALGRVDPQVSVLLF